MISLIRKELRTLVPYVGLLGAMILFALLAEMFSGIPQLASLRKIVQDCMTLKSDNAIVLLVLMFAVMTSLFAREYDDQTIEFLDALPTSRGRIFLCKLLAAWAIMLLFHVLDMVLGFVLASFTRNSLHEPWDSRFLGTAFGLRMCVGYFICGWTICLAMLRGFGWLVFGMLVTVYLIVEQLWPALEWLNFLSLASSDLSHSAWEIPKRSLVLQFWLSSFLYLAAYLQFLGFADFVARSIHRARQSVFGNLTLSAVTVTAAVLTVGILGYLSIQNEPEIVDESLPRFRNAGISRRVTERFEAIYLNHQSDLANALLTEADTLDAQVRNFFRAGGASVGPGWELSSGRITIDMNSSSARHAGLASWNRVILNLNGERDFGFHRGVLAHELAHVYLDRISDNRLSQNFGSTRFFHEGVATYVEWRIGGALETRDNMRAMAALLGGRLNVRVEKLMDDQDLREQYDQDIVYPLGELFAAALVDCYGEEAIPRLAQAFVRKDAPKDLRGVTLWHDTFQACGFNLETVTRRYQVRMQEVMEAYEDLLQALPRLHAEVTIHEDNVWFTLPEELPEGWRVICRLRNHRSAADSLYRLAEPQDSLNFFAPVADFSGANGWYQLGAANGDRIVFEEWQSFSLQ